MKTLIFDWGDTVMRDFPELKTPMFTWEHVELIPDVEEALNILSKQYMLVIATNAGQSNTAAMIKALKRVGVEKYFTYFFSSKDLGYEKPDPNFFITIANTIKCDVNECVMIGNLYEKDIVGAKDAGMNTILFDERNLNNLNPKANFVIYSMKDLPKVIENII
jgi:putative hydrolase of the HAD superfamily